MSCPRSVCCDVQQPTSAFPTAEPNIGQPSLTASGAALSSTERSVKIVTMTTTAPSSPPSSADRAGAGFNKGTAVHCTVNGLVAPCTFFRFASGNAVVLGLYPGPTSQYRMVRPCAVRESVCVGGVDKILAIVATVIFTRCVAE